MDRWFCKRVWLGLFFLLFGVFLHRRRLNWVVAWVAALQAVTHVNTGALAAFRDSHCAWPPQRLEHVDCEAYVLTLPSIGICVLLCVANDLADPAWLLTREKRMLADVAEPLDSGIFCLKLFHRRPQLLLRQVERLVRDAACLQDDLVHVAPRLDVA